MGRTTSKGNEVKSKMKYPSDMPTSRFKHGGSDLWSSTLPLAHGGAPTWILSKQQQYIREICFLKLKSLSNVTPRLHTVCNGVLLSVRIGVGKQRISLVGYLNGPIILKSGLSALNLSLLFVVQLEILETVT